jgi:sulfite oxidase
LIIIFSFITEDGYHRNHGSIPNLSAETHIVRVDGAVRSPLSLSISQLQQEYPQHEVVCALQCAGNRRHTMRTMIKDVQGIDWFDGAVMNCVWKGPKLADILQNAGLELGDTHGKHYEGWHVAFACTSTACEEDSWFGGSIPLERAVNNDAEVILALEVQTFTIDYGNLR